MLIFFASVLKPITILADLLNSNEDESVVFLMKECSDVGFDFGTMQQENQPMKSESENRNR